MNAVQESAIAHYLGKGLSKDVAVGLASVLYVESALNPGSQGAQATEHGGALNPSGAYGIASWNGPRQQALSAYATRYGKDVAALTTQLDFVLTEAANSYPTVWAAIRNAAIWYSDFITIMVDDYEIPADKRAEIAKAVALAKELRAEVVEPSLPTVAPVPVTTSVPSLPTIPTLDPQTLAFITQLIVAFLQAAKTSGLLLK